MTSEHMGQGRNGYVQGVSVRHCIFIFSVDYNINNAVIRQKAAPATGWNVCNLVYCCTRNTLYTCGWEYGEKANKRQEPDVHRAEMIGGWKSIGDFDISLHRRGTYGL